MRVVVAMSGGVDSSVAAKLLRDAGHDVIGVFLRNGVVADQRAPKSRHQGCCSVRDACDAEEVAGILDIPFHSLDHSEEFATIIDTFVSEYAAGRTPNPCVQCNRSLKFGALLNFADAMGADRIATGHYARLERKGSEVVLRRALALDKDQSYVLATVRPEALQRTVYPLGDLPKKTVREIAESSGLPVFDKAESQEICFVPTGNYRDLLRNKRPELFAPGEIVDQDGAVVGTHSGAVGFTVGQRRGLGIGGGGGPRYVTATDPKTNRVTVGDRRVLQQQSLRLRSLNWLVPAPATAVDWNGILQIRAHHVGRNAILHWQPGMATVRLTMEAPGEVVSPGQIGVFYRDDQVLLAGTVERDQ